jgi:hypothetical protein
MMRRAALGIAAAVAVVVLVLLVPLLLPAGGSPDGSSTAVERSTPNPAGLAVPPSPLATAPVASVARSEPVAPATDGFNCTALATGWGLVDGPQPAPAVAPSLESPCVLGHDEPALYFVSNATHSGADVRFSLSLPVNGTPSASTSSAYWMGMWAQGPGCSYNDESYLTVELLPPYDPIPGVPPSPDWQVRAPLWSLVPAGACDAQCENDTAFFTIDGRSFCEDDAVQLTTSEPSIGAFDHPGPLSAVLGAFRPGDVLTVDLTGAGGALTVRINDTDDPSLDLNWNYGGDFITSGPGYVPLYSTASTANGGWTGGLDVGVGEMTCPLPVHGGAFGSACNSYNGAFQNVTPSPELLAVESWNSTTHTFSNRFPAVETMSSSGACAGGSEVPACADFSAFGGTGDYPAIAVSSTDGRAWYSIGGSSADVRSTFGGGTLEYPTNGSLSGLKDPTTLSATTAVGSNEVGFDVRAIDPSGVAAVVVSSWWCTVNANRTSLAFPATLSGAPVNTSYDGNWTVEVPTGSAGKTGTFFYSVRARSTTGAFSPFLYGTVAITSGGGGGCGSTFPSAPGFDGSDVYPIGGGYAVQWNESEGSAPRNFTVEAVPAAGGTTVSFPVGNVTSTRITGLVGNTSYHLEVVAWNAAGLSAHSVVVDASATLYPLLLRAPNVTASSTWVNQTTVRVTANATGGLPLFAFTFAFGDGSSAHVNTSGDEASVIHYYGNNYTGDAVVTVSVTDSVGDTAVASPAVVYVRGTLLATPGTLEGGDLVADLHFSPPGLPTVNASAFQVTGYLVFWTTNATWAPYLTGALFPGLNNSTALVPDVTVATIAPGHPLVSAFPVPNGMTAYAQVVALDQYGEGLLGPELSDGASPVLSTTAEPLLASIGAPYLPNGAGGTAPFTADVNASFTMSDGTTISSGTYRLSTGGFGNAGIWQGDGFAWVNVSVTFTSPGSYVVTLYVVSSVYDGAVLPVDFLVTAGAAPIVGTSVAPSPVWAGTAATLGANVSGGSGHYNYTWTLGNGTIGTTASLTYLFATTGTYLVGLNVTDTLWGGATNVVVPVTVLALPSVEIAVTANGTAGTYRFTAVVLNGYGNFSYTWLFDDGSQGSGVSVSHTFAAEGTYTITLEATDGYGHTVTSTTVIVYGGTTIINPASSGVPVEEAYFLLALAIALALLVVLLVVRGRRRPPETEAAAPGEPAAYEDLPAPEPNYEEDAPSLQ